MSISPQPYKGTRDFYPAQLLKRNYIFEVWRQTLQSFGYQEYDASIMENAEIYLIKSGEELGSKQLYSFVDKGDRKVALRPEMTPSLARIVANKFGELKFPLRWFSIPNCFRYERPQKGRLREFWQLNVDLVGKPAGLVDLEILFLAGKLVSAFGATPEMFQIRFNHRQILDNWLTQYELIEFKELIYATLDDWFKLTLEQNQTKLAEQLNPEQITKIVDLCSKQNQPWQDYLTLAEELPEVKLILETLPLIAPEINFEFTPTIIRGLAYYTGLVFEGFSLKAESPRAIFGGGRYDNLMDLFGKKAEAIGFGLGEVPFGDFLDDWNLLPELKQTQKTGIILLNPDSVVQLYQQTIPELQAQKIDFEIDYDFERSENKRYESLKKKNCNNILKI
jgi:histidyl-tRNA synthetase